MGVSPVGGIFVHQSATGRFGEQSTSVIRERARTGPRSAEQQAQARELAQAITAASEQELLEIAPTLLEAEPASRGGATQFPIRALALGIAATAYQHRRAQKNLSRQT